MSVAPSRPLPPKAPPPPPMPGKVAEQPQRETRIVRGVQASPQKIVIYGPGGSGKTELAANMTKIGMKPIFIDLEDGTKFLDVARIDVYDFDDLRAKLNPTSNLLDEFDTVVIDSLTKAEELATAWTIANVKHPDKDYHVSSIEGYGFGKGLQFVFETMLRLLGDLDNLCRRGKNVVMIAHECVANVPNPTGTDWIRYEPRLQSPTSGKSSVRHRVKEFADHLLFIGFDVVIKDGIATGHGTRTIYPFELPSHWAKSRLLSEAIPYERGSAELWKLLFNR